MNAEIDIRGVTLRTDRLLLRPWRETDVEDLYAYASVEGVGPMAGWREHADREESERILAMFMAEGKTFALEYGGRVVGSLGVDTYDEERFPEFTFLRCRELGFVLSRDCWGQGLMPEAVREVCRWLFSEVGLDVILCGHFLWNRQSGRVQEKCGFRHYSFGTYRTEMGETQEHEYTLLTREDWLSGI